MIGGRSSRLLISNTNEGILVSLPRIGKTQVCIPFAGEYSVAIQRKLSKKDQLKLVVLDDLHSQDIIGSTDHQGILTIPFTKLRDLDQYDRMILGIPQSISPSIHIAADGVLGRAGMRLSATVTHDEVGALENVYKRRDGAYIVESSILPLEPEAADLLAACDQFNQADHPEDQLKALASIKRLAGDAKASLDPYLISENIVAADGLDIDVDLQSSNQGRLSVKFKEGIPEEVSAALKHGAPPGNVVSAISADGGRARVVIDAEEKAVIQKYAAPRTLRGSDIPKLLVEPEAILGPELDLAKFSPRVRGIIPKVKEARARLAFNPSGRDWFNAEMQVSATDVPFAEELSAGVFEQSAPFAGDEAPGTASDQYAGLNQAKQTESDFDLPVDPEDIPEDGYVETPDGWVKVDKRSFSNVNKAVQEIKSKYPDGFNGEQLRYILDVISNENVLEYTEIPDELADFAKPNLQFVIPESMTCNLYDYQAKGCSWLWNVVNWKKHPGALLADEMGLGKTVQVIAILAKLFDERRLAPTLVVLPGSLIDNWNDELQKFAPGLPEPYIHHSSYRIKDASFLEDQPITLTTYETLRSDQLILGQVKWRVLVCDESQKVKNPAAGVTRAIKGMHSDIKIALTGTPVENNLSELWCQVDLLVPGLLGSVVDFKDRWARSIENPETDPAMREQAAQDLRATIQPNYLRRLKRDARKDLSPLTEHAFHVPIGDLQKRKYAEVIKAAKQADIGMRLAMLQRLIMICSHPRADSGQVDVLPAASQLLAECPKLIHVIEYIKREVAPVGEKVLLFSKYKAVQRILQAVIQDQLPGPAFPILNGEINTRSRLSYIKRFNAYDGFAAMVLSPEATGVGLNLQGANHIVHYTRLWNPAKEAQATARAHRIGQDLPVDVQLPIVAFPGDYASVEEKLHELLEDKRQLAEDVIWPTEKLDVQNQLAEEVFAGAQEA